jgi:hypothetical protein
MKIKLQIIFLVTLAMTFQNHGSAQSGGAFDLNWSTIDGGGGTSGGGVFSLSAAIGQPEAGTAMTGGAFSLTGGFWSAVQMPGAPLLTVIFSGNRAVVSWPSPSTGFLLQQRVDLNPSSWVPAPEAVTDNGTNRFIIVNPPTGNRFYRLFKP